MSYINDFPKTRTYDSDLGFLIREYMRLKKDINNIEYQIQLLNKIYDKIKNDIEEITIEQLEEWLENGTLEQIIQNSFNNLELRSEFQGNKYYPNRVMNFTEAIQENKPYFLQGSCCVGSNIIYCLCQLAQEATNINGTLVEIDKNGNELRRKELPISHANSITYRKSTNSLLIIPLYAIPIGGENPTGIDYNILEYDYDSLTLINTYNMSQYGAPFAISCDYKTDVVYLKIRNDNNIYIFNNGVLHKSNCIVNSSVNNQNMLVANGILYFEYVSPNIIEVYDINENKFITQFYVDRYNDNFLVGEMESIMYDSINDILYFASIYATRLYNGENVIICFSQLDGKHLSTVNRMQATQQIIYYQPNTNKFSDGSESQPFNTLTECIWCALSMPSIIRTIELNNNISTQEYWYLPGVEKLIIQNGTINGKVDITSSDRIYLENIEINYDNDVPLHAYFTNLLIVANCRISTQYDYAIYNQNSKLAIYGNTSITADKYSVRNGSPFKVNYSYRSNFIIKDEYGSSNGSGMVSYVVLKEINDSVDLSENFIQQLSVSNKLILTGYYGEYVFSLVIQLSGNIINSINSENGRNILWSNILRLGNGNIYSLRSQININAKTRKITLIANDAINISDNTTSDTYKLTINSYSLI